MGKTLFYQVNAHGHVNPSLSLAAELVRRGEEVIYYLTDEFREAVEATGATFRSYGAAYPPDLLEGIYGQPFVLAARMIDACRRIVPELMEAAHAEQPDYIIYDAMAPWGWMVAENLGVPSVSSMALLALHPKVLLAGGMFPSMVAQIVGSFGKVLEYNRTAAAFRRESGLKTPPLPVSLNAPGDLTINYTSSLFQPYAELFTGYEFVGPAMDFQRPAVEFPFERLSDKPLIYISLGTVNNDARLFYHACFEAFADDRYQVVLSIGKRIDAASLGSIPANFIVRPYVPQLDILQRADAFITHGGMNSVHEGLYYNVPLVVVPQTDEQTLVGRQVARLGAGVLLKKQETNPAQLREAAERILSDPAYRSNATRVGESFRQAGGVRRAADVILARFGSRQPAAAG